MAKTRAFIKDCLRLIYQDLAISTDIVHHRCIITETEDETTQYLLQCPICVILHRTHDALALVYFARKYGLIHLNFYSSEVLLIAAVGEERYYRMVENQVRLYDWCPPLTCGVCSASMKLYEKKRTVKDILIRHGRYTFHCKHCNERNILLAGDFKEVIKKKQNRTRPKQARLENRLSDHL